MKRSKLLVFVFCGLFSANSFALSDAAGFRLFFAGKALFDGLVTWQQIEQIGAMDDILRSLPEENCHGVCRSNSNQVHKSVSNAKGSANFSAAVSVLSDVINVMGFGFTFFFGDEILRPWAFAAIGASGINFVSTLVANAFLWDAKIRYTDGLPKKTEKEFEKAMNDGVFPLIGTGIIALPVAITGCVVAAAGDG